MSKFIKALFFLLILHIPFSSCTRKSKEKSEASFSVAIEGDPKTLDPRKARDLCSSSISRILFEGLTKVESSGSVSLALADQIEVSEDGLTYSIILKDAFWSNGEKVTSRDFEYAWKSLLSPGFISDTAYQLYPILNAKKIKEGILSSEALGFLIENDRKFFVTLETPSASFLKLLSLPSFFPVCAKALQVNPFWDQNPEVFVSNGPYTLHNWERGSRLDLCKNQFYRNENVTSSKSLSFIISDSETALRLFEDGKLDWIGSPLSQIPSDAMKGLKRSGTLRSEPFLGTRFCRLNLSSGPLKNRALRKALHLALDRHSIVEHVLQGGEKEAFSLVPNFENVKPRGDLQPELLAFLKNEIGGLKKPLVLSFYNNQINARLAQAMQKNWQETLEIAVEIEAIEGKLFFERVANLDYEIALGSWIADFNDPLNFLEVFKLRENGVNNTGWQREDYIDLLNRSELLRDVVERATLLSQAEAILMEDLPILPIYHFVQNYVTRDSEQNLSVSLEGHFNISEDEGLLEHAL